jgi:hypothetical protein
MPYFVYKIFPEDQLELVDTYEVFKEAKNVCREMRKSMAGDEGYQVRMIFAKDTREARRLLTTKRKASPVEEWEA